MDRLRDSIAGLIILALAGSAGDGSTMAAPRLRTTPRAGFRGCRMSV